MTETTTTVAVPTALTPELRLKRAVEIGIVYLGVAGAHHKQFGLEAVLALLTGCDDVPAFRAKFRPEGVPWPDGIPA